MTDCCRPIETGEDPGAGPSTPLARGKFLCADKSVNVVIVRVGLFVCLFDFSLFTPKLLKACFNSCQTSFGQVKIWTLALE